MPHTKQGVNGFSQIGELTDTKKADPMSAFLGGLEELDSYIRLIKSKLTPVYDFKQDLDDVQNILLAISTSVVEPNSSFPMLSVSASLEEKTAYYKNICRQFSFIKSGDCELSAMLDTCRYVSQRAKLSLCAVINIAYDSRGFVEAGFVTENIHLELILDRLNAFLFTLARYADFINTIEKAVRQIALDIANKADRNENSNSTTVSNRIQAKTITPYACRIVSQALEERAALMKLDIAVAFCDTYGNPVLAFAAPNALALSFDCALKKAYTSAALRMTTAHAQKLIQPGGMFFGLATERLLAIPGGVPIYGDGVVIGAIGVSGGGGTQDKELAEYGAQLFESVICTEMR